jgi:hypothetical protein
MQKNVSGYKGLKSIAKKPAGGFCFINARSLLAAWILFKREAITLYDLRLWLACHEMLARRCTLAPGRMPTFREQELILLLGSGTTAKAKKGIQRLTKAGLLQWEQNCITTDTAIAEASLEYSDDWLDTLSLVKNNRRKAPMPRRMLCHIIKSRHRTLIGTVFGYLFRCLYYRRDCCVSGGRCKSSWIAAALQLDLRNVKTAKKQLIELGWIIPGHADQRSLNRWGMPVVINLQWEAVEKVKNRKTPPPIAQNHAKVPPPIYNNKPLTGSNNQKPQRALGVKTKTRVYSEPTLKHITLEDLRDSMLLDQLYQEATEAGSLPYSQSSRLNWFAMAEHALAVGKQNPCGLFVSLFRKKLWHYITQEQEDHARAKLKKLDFGEDSHVPGKMCSKLPIYDSLAA